MLSSGYSLAIASGHDSHGNLKGRTFALTCAQARGQKLVTRETRRADLFQEESPWRQLSDSLLFLLGSFFGVAENTGRKKNANRQHSSSADPQKKDECQNCNALLPIPMTSALNWQCRNQLLDDQGHVWQTQPASNMRANCTVSCAGRASPGEPA
eukprot:1160908-Pelagomonas_calceolata.AAC.18